MSFRGGEWSVAEQQIEHGTASGAASAGSPSTLYGNNVGYYPGDALEEARASLERCLMSPPAFE